MRSLLATTLALVWLLGGCAPKIVDEPVIFELTRPAIDFDVFAGDVTIDVDDRYPATTVHLVRRTAHGMFRGDDARASLKHIDGRVELVGVDGASIIQVRATTVDPEPHFQQVSVRITTPSPSSLRIRTTRGDIQLREARGIIDVATTEADINLRTTRPLTGPVTMTTSKGKITLRISADSRGALDLASVHGIARLRIPDALTTNLRSTGPGGIRATLNGGENPIILRTTRETIRLEAVTDVIASGNYDG
jgi:DUF4097 and DUF4098 domain-containing protein YvlB